jgi:ADP-ribosylation factor-binding protein GGA
MFLLSKDIYTYYHTLERLLTLNDMINNVTAKYADLRKGIYDTHYEVNGTQPQQTNSTEPPKQAISLIDFDDDVPSHGSSTQQPKQPSSTSSSTNLMDELDGLFGPSSTTTTAAPSTRQNADLFDLVAPMGSLSMNATPQIPQQQTAISPNLQSISSPASHPTSLLPDSTFGSPKTSVTVSNQAVSTQPDVTATAESCKCTLHIVNFVLRLLLTLPLL